jgi:pyridoxamine 5'-phosphate oxidase
MTLATVDGNGRPTARMIICQGFDAAAGWFAFYTDRDSPKGHALATRPQAALVFNWDTPERQLRVEGPVTPAPDEEADAYWRTRPLDARVVSVTAHQSRPLPSRSAFLGRLAETAARLGDTPPRPERWGGYRVWAERVELWVGQPGRAHDRALWSRAVRIAGADVVGGPWRVTRLEP